jgi:hypothetical protein
MSGIIPGGYNDPDAPGNTDPEHRRPDLQCADQPCDEVPGTAWSPYWCFAHNVERIDRITRQLDELASKRREH